MASCDLLYSGQLSAVVGVSALTRRRLGRRAQSASPVQRIWFGSGRTAPSSRRSRRHDRRGSRPTDVVESPIVLGVAAISSGSVDTRILLRRTRWKPELGVDGAVDDASLEAVVCIAKGDRGGHGTVAAAEYASTVVLAAKCQLGLQPSGLGQLPGEDARLKAGGWCQAWASLSTGSPCTLSSMANLAFILKDQGSTSRPISIMKDCCDRRAVVLRSLSILILYHLAKLSQHGS